MQQINMHGFVRWLMGDIKRNAAPVVSVVFPTICSSDWDFVPQLGQFLHTIYVDLNFAQCEKKPNGWWQLVGFASEMWCLFVLVTRFRSDQIRCPTFSVFLCCTCFFIHFFLWTFSLGRMVVLSFAIQILSKTLALMRLSTFVATACLLRMTDSSKPGAMLFSLVSIVRKLAARSLVLASVCLHQTNKLHHFGLFVSRASRRAQENELLRQHSVQPGGAGDGAVASGGAAAHQAAPHRHGPG